MPATPSITLRRRTLALLAVTCLGVILPAQAQADFPNKPVNIYTPFPPGGDHDTLLRALAGRLSQQWQRPVRVHNRRGAGGFNLFENTRRLPPDGYHLVHLDSEHLATVPLLTKSRNFDPMAAYDMVAALYRTPLFVAVPTKSPWKSAGDLIAAAKAQPGHVNYGSWGVGSLGHLGAEQLALDSGIQMQHIPFKAPGPMFAELAGEEFAWALGTAADGQTMRKNNKVRYLAVAAPQRVPQLPDVPTVAESGGPKDFAVSSFVVLAAPRGIAPALRAKIAQDVGKAMQAADIRTGLDSMAAERLDWSPSEIAQQLTRRAAVVERLLKRQNIRLD